MLKMNLITRKELWGDLYEEVYMDLGWKLYWGLGWELGEEVSIVRGQLGFPIRTEFRGYNIVC